MDDTTGLILGLISSQLGAYVSTVAEEILNTSKVPLSKLLEACETDPVASACIQLKAARARQLMNGDYINDNENIKKFIDRMIEEMEGSLPDLGEKMISALPLGFSVSEFGLYIKRNFLQLKKFHYLDPKETRFQVHAGKICSVKYQDGNVKKTIPYNKVLHIINGTCISFGKKSLYGTPEMLRAYPFIKLKQLMFSEIAITSRRIATGILIGKTDPQETVLLLDNKGNPIARADGRGNKTITSARQLGDAFKKLENNSFLITSKNNDINVMNVPAGEQFWNLILNLVNEQIMRSFLTPDTIWAQGVATFGLSGLSSTQLNILDSSINAAIGQIKDQIIERIIKPLICMNFGKQKRYGKLDTSGGTDPSMVNQNTSMILSSIQSGVIPNTDLAAVNKLRKNIGLPEITEESQKFQIEQQAQLQKLAAMASQMQIQNPQGQIQEKP